MSTTARVYFDIEGPDDQALKEGFGWLFAQALGGRGVVAVPSLQQVENLVPGLSAGEAARLKKDKRLQRLGATIELVTERSGRPVVGAPVLGVWVDDEQLEKLERARPSAVCVIPWLRDDIRRWRAAYSPTEMRSGASGPKSAIANPVVARALGDLTVRVNLSTGLGHPSDKAAAVGTFRILLAGGERFDPDEVAAWAANNGWSLSAARELAEIAAGVLAGRRYRVERHGWRDDILELWRAEARGE